mmetsp:Transcript_9511/g.14687  ORF Transcript_9511/g.14687 Transcript_9511/m.14687 type:complete len:207 (+) Transcript_9511:121-741(+)
MILPVFLVQLLIERTASLDVQQIPRNAGIGHGRQKYFFLFVVERVEKESIVQSDILCGDCCSAGSVNDIPNGIGIRNVTNREIGTDPPLRVVGVGYFLLQFLNGGATQIASVYSKALACQVHRITAVPATKFDKRLGLGCFGSDHDTKLGWDTHREFLRIELVPIGTFFGHDFILNVLAIRTTTAEVFPHLSWHRCRYRCFHSHGV